MESVNTLLWKALAARGRELLGGPWPRRYTRGQPSATLSLRVPEEAARRIEALARAEGVPVARLLADLLAAGLAAREAARNL